MEYLPSETALCSHESMARHRLSKWPFTYRMEPLPFPDAPVSENRVPLPQWSQANPAQNIDPWQARMSRIVNNSKHMPRVSAGVFAPQDVEGRRQPALEKCRVRRHRR